MKFRYAKRIGALAMATVMAAGMLTGCGKKAETNANGQMMIRFLKKLTIIWQIRSALSWT